MVEIVQNPPDAPVNQEAQNDADADPIPPHVPRTHVNPDVIQMIKELPLYNKLEMNKAIEANNHRRKLAKLNHRLLPAAHPVDGSDTASMVTIGPEELKELLDDEVREQYRPVMYIAITKWVSDTQKAMAEGESSPSKRGFNATVSKVNPVEARVAKRRCMSGLLLMPRVIGTPSAVQFPQTLFETENCVSVPLPFFLNKNLRYIVDNLATLPTVKSNPLAGETKGISILDVEKLSVTLGKECTLTCSQWTEAAFQFFRFQQERDEDGPDGPFARWYDDHFSFFNSQDDRDEMYEAWKGLELKLRQEFRRAPTTYDPVFHAGKYDLAKSEANVLAQMRAMNKPDNRDRFSSSFSSRGGLGGNGKFSRPFNSNSSFPSSSLRSPLTPCCILCAQRGHTLSEHANDSMPAKFIDGKSVWAKFINKVLCTPDNREICIRYNLKGDRHGCSHNKDERAHICSFCGKPHSAFSWTCRSRPNN